MLSNLHILRTYIIKRNPCDQHNDIVAPPVVHTTCQNENVVLGGGLYVETRLVPVVALRLRTMSEWPKGRVGATWIWRLAAAAWISFANVFSFLPIRREILTSDVTGGLSNIAQIVGVVQSIFGLILFFLLGLALRSRFRMR